MERSSGAHPDVYNDTEQDGSSRLRPGFYWIRGTGNYELRRYRGRQQKLHVEFEVLGPAPDEREDTAASLLEGEWVEGDPVEEIPADEFTTDDTPVLVTRYYNCEVVNGLVKAGLRSDLLAEYIHAGGRKPSHGEGIDPNMFRDKVLRARLEVVDRRDGGAPYPPELHYLKVSSIWSRLPP